MSYQNIAAEKAIENEMATDIEPVQKKGVLNITEDILAVLIGGIIIADILALTAFVNGFKFELPIYQWENKEDLVNKVLSFQNILVLVQTGLLFIILSSAAVALSGGSIKKFIGGFL